MWEDPIVNELHQLREAHAVRFDYDIDAIFRDLQTKEQHSDAQYVSFASTGVTPDKQRNARKRSPKIQRVQMPI